MIELFTIVFGALSLSSIFKPNLRSNYLFLLVLIPLILCSGLRWEMGTDWRSYYNLFTKNENFYFMEPGYQYYVEFIRKFTDNYSVFLLITDTLTIGGILSLIFEYTKKNYLSVFYATGTLLWYAGSLRQMLALLILTYAIRFIIKRKFIFYLILVIISTFFHKTSLFYIAIYFAYNLSLGLIAVILLSLFFITPHIIFLYDLVLNFFYSNNGLGFRLYKPEDENSSNYYLGFTRKILTFSIIYFIYKKWVSVFDWKEERVFKFYIKMLILSIYFYLVGTFYIVFVSSRMDIFPAFICTPILIGLIDNRLTKNYQRIILLLIVLIFNLIFYTRLEYMDLFHPYSSIFYNFDLSRELY